MLKKLEIIGFKSFARKATLDFSSATTAIVGPNGSGKSNVAEAFRFALGEQSMKSMRGKRSEDLIFNGSPAAPRANRAAVTIVFDNTSRVFPIDFNEVSLERAVFRDGTSDYRINGSKVRLRDIQELLARANIGESGHHIISQGEADRILLATPRERRAMLEDALGLRVYEFKKQDAERKLEKTQENMERVESLRRELAPHLRFLGKQIEKLEKAEEIAREIAQRAREYFAREDAYLVEERRKAQSAREQTADRFALLSAELSAVRARTGDDGRSAEHERAVQKAEARAEEARARHSALLREMGRVEGALAEARKRARGVHQDPYAKIPRADIIALRDDIESHTQKTADTPEALRAALIAIRTTIRAFAERFITTSQDYLADEEHALQRLEKEREDLARKEQDLAREVEKAQNALAEVRMEARAYEESRREEGRRTIDLAQEHAHSEAELARLDARLAELARLAQEEERERQEISALIGPAALSTPAPIDLPPEPRAVQEKRRTELERLKIRLEETGGAGEDIRREFDEVSARDQFLARELADLTASKESLQTLIDDLENELAKNFAQGLEKVNAFFGDFFSLMFGGGSARLVLEGLPTREREEEEEEVNEEDTASLKSKPGIDVSVHVPKKRVQSLVQLSGGERALTSIALIFAMSRVNPPPFLILDETDAALDEANSRRYGDMIEALAQQSQLIVITHNRETMRRAGTLYGVTMGENGISKLLSVKFDEAVAVAK